jgi:heterodisulfide reductase subunit A-like polyferredoxin
MAQLETDVPGIYLCGGATGPIDISESVVQATAASMKAVIRKGAKERAGALEDRPGGP